MGQSKFVLVTGATGKQGGAVVEALLTRGHQVRALTRNSASSAANRLRQQGVEIAVGDFTDHDSLVRAARGAHSPRFPAPRPPQPMTTMLSLLFRF